MQAYSPATVLGMARAFSAERENLSRDVIFILDGAETMASIGEASVISAFGPARQNAATHKKISDSIEKNAKELQLLERLLCTVLNCESVISRCYLRRSWISHCNTKI
jgi:hypothetical protein